jgi:multidrug efflux pump subunit AcrA (membrane-fusion protein)
MVKKDMPVVVTLDAHKGTAFAAKVTQIAAVANSDWDDNRKTFEVEVTMDPIEIDLRAGTTAKCEIQVETIPDVLQVPIHAVVVEEGKSLCFLPVATGFEEREVKVGKNNAHFVQVLEGLNKGERVLLYDPRDSGASHKADAAGAKEAPQPTPGAPLESVTSKAGS